MAPALLEDPAIRQRAFSFTVARYHTLGEQGLIPEQVELLEGVIIGKLPKSPLHSFLVMRLLKWLQKVIDSDRDVRVEQPITCRDSEPEPDLAVIRGQLEDYVQAHPHTAELVIEIAVSSAEIDRRKTAIYAAAEVVEYWIVLPEKHQIEVHTGLVNAQYTLRRLFSEGQTVQSEVLPAFQVDLDELFPA